MIRFVDTHTGDVYNGDMPYIHWFDGIQSVGLNYAKQFIVISDNSSITVRMDSEVFSLVDDTKLTEFVKIHQKDYLDLSKITAKEITLLGTEHEGMYVYSFNIIAKGVYVGEVTDEFIIGNTMYQVGADFVDENESLGVNLTNFGMELPNEIQRAIYVQNIHEQKPDYVLLNRKFKELLNEYINIIANKGSYKSLINSLNWFEYGDLVHIYEYWRHEEPTRKMLSKNDITQYVTEKIENILSAFQKTTYISICCALTNCKKVHGEIQYVPETDSTILHAEPIPELENIATLWNRTEMSLKMVLLGNFFATYFMPIHLDLIHCSIEDVVFADTIKASYIPKSERFDYIDNLPILTCNLKDLYHLDVIEAFTNSKTPFGFLNNGVDTPFTYEDNDIMLCGVDTKFDTEMPDYVKAHTLVNHFKGIGVLVPFHCELENVGDNYITNGTLYIYRDNELVLKRTTDQIPHTPKNNKVIVDFNVLLQQAGKYTIQLSFSRTDGCVYARTFNFTVDGERYQNISMYKMIPRYTSIDDKRENFDMSKWMVETNDDSALPFGSIADYVLDPVAHQDLNVYRQFFAANKQALENTVHLNQVFIIRIPGRTVINTEQPNTMCVFGIDKSEQEFTLSDMLKANDIKWYRAEKVKDMSVLEKDEQDLTDDDFYTFYFGINLGDTGAKDTTRFTLKRKKSDVKVWVDDTFIPYFYTLKRIGEVEITEQIQQQLTEEQLYQLKNSSEAYTIHQQDVVCFLPELRITKRPTDFMWKFICQSTNSTITPISWRQESNYKNKNLLVPSDKITTVSEQEYQKVHQQNPTKYNPTLNRDFPTIVQPILGRYDFSILPDCGYYDVVLNYKLDENEENQTREISSQFIVSK